MPAYSRKIEISGKSAQELYDVISSGIERVLAKSAIGGFEVMRDSEARSLEIRSKLMSASLIFRDGEIHVDGRLSLIAAAFRSKIDERIEHWVERAFGRAD